MPTRKCIRQNKKLVGKAPPTGGNPAEETDSNENVEKS